MVDDSSRHADGLLRMLAPGSRVAGYLLESQIGAGGMAVVFRARDERLGRMVALKVLAPGLAADDAFRQRFIRESRAAAAVDDPHIIPVYEAGESGGVLFIAMRLVVGGDLRSVMLREGPLAAERAAALLSPVASALDAAHAAGLVHRDVKPANVLVDARPGRPEHVYLSDFGLSKRAAAAAGLTGSGQFMGTAEYAAPEQINGRAGERAGRSVRAGVRGIRGAERRGAVRPPGAHGRAVGAPVRAPALAGHAAARPSARGGPDPGQGAGKGAPP